MVFSKIEDAVLSGKVDAGVIIHENRFTYESRVLKKICDLGELWEKETGQPIPLGGIAVRRNLPDETKEKINRVVRRSVEFAMANPGSSYDYVKQHAQEMDEEVRKKHIALYVNGHSVDLGTGGRKAIEIFFDKALQFGIIHSIPGNIFWNTCVEFGLPLVYASSAATYGAGENGYDDTHILIEKLKPLNPYGESKNEFDKWALKQEREPYFWAGLKFFNVYGPNEYHKGRMASVVFHAFNQIKETGKMKLFHSHNPKYKDGEQLRDFIYVKDAVDVCFFLMQHRKNSGIYNLGTGKARTFIDLVQNVFISMDKKANIEFIDTPADIQGTYQYFTEAKMEKLRSISYDKPFISLEKGVRDYIKNFLLK